MTGIAPLWANPGDDCTISGNLQINGQNAPAGSLVEAYIDDEKIVSTRTIQAGKYEITIPKYDPADPSQKGYHSENDVVLIKVDNRKAEPTFNPAPGAMKINLNVNTSLSVKLTTWGKIKALFK